MQGYNDNWIFASRYVPVILLSLLNTKLIVSATCISLHGSKLCPSFSNSSISTLASSVFPFMSFISNVEEFDSGLQDYVKQEYVRSKYIDVMHCQNINLANTTDLYSRFTTTILCSSIVAESQNSCPSARIPVVCADTCGDFAQSQYSILFTPQLCNGTYDKRADLLRSDFTICSNPSGSLDPKTCIQGLANEPHNCGYGTNLVQLCGFCSSSLNQTSTCCSNSDLSACQNISLPVSPTIPASFLPNPTQTPSIASEGKSGLSTGKVVGISTGAAVLFIILALFVVFFLRNRSKVSRNAFNDKYPSIAKRKSLRPNVPPPPPFTTPPGGVARLSALRQPVDDDDDEFATSGQSPPKVRNREISGVSLDSMSPTSATKSLHPPLPTNVSNSSPAPVSHHPSYTETISNSEADLAESMNEYNDHYSSNIITPGCFAAALWTYEPKMADEMSLDRGDLVKVVAVWNDGWATGVKLARKIWDSDSALFSSQLQENVNQRNSKTPLLHEDISDIKAFPLVCVCHESAWSEIIAQIDSSSPGSVSKKSSTTRLGLKRSFSGRSRKAGKSSRFDSSTKESSSSPQQSSSSGILYQAFPLAPPRRSNSPSPNSSSRRRSQLDGP